MPTPLEDVARRLRHQFARSEVILFTGAGFSAGATDRLGRAIPQARELQAEIWQLVWPDDDVETESSLRDTYAAALAEARSRLSDLLRSRLTIDPSSVTDDHRTWLSMPWRRVYTVNIDDLEAAAQRQFELPRRIRPHSALAGRLPIDVGGDLLYVHLNGMLDDVPDVTFTDPQYGLRHSQSNPLYEHLAAELLSYPVVFVGTQLRESLLWEYIALRDERGSRGVTENRRASFLVTSDLPRDRERLLTTYNVHWVQATMSEFATAVLANLREERDAGHAFIRASSAYAKPGAVVLPRVVDLASLPAQQQSDYLFGTHPTWGDIRSGRAVERKFEEEIDLDSARGCLLVTGTAGAGTSTTLMRLALRLSARDRDVRFLDADHNFDGRQLGRHLRAITDSLVLAIDDADTFGSQLNEIVRDVLDNGASNVLLILGMRASRVDHILSDWTVDGQRTHEVDVPLLEDSDIQLLLAALEADNKLGALKRLTDDRRVATIREKCGRELLVAMIEATSGELFEVKAFEEFDELEPEQKLIYGIVAIASELRFPLLKEEILLACNDLSNTALFAHERLVARRLVVPSRGGYVLRHRRIAELVVEGMRKSGQLLTPYRGLLRAVAARYQPHQRRARETKLVTALMSHQRMARNFAIGDARAIYNELEELANDDYHFWLQRGSLEVQDGSLALARNWLQQAFDGGEHDYRVQTEWAYYLLKSAWKNANAEDAFSRVEEAHQILLDQIAARGTTDTYVWHVYGSQTLAWIRRAALADEERARQLEVVKKQMEEAVRRHPRARDATVP